MQISFNQVWFLIKAHISTVDSSEMSSHTHLFDIVSGFSASLNKHYIQFFGFPLSFLNRNLPEIIHKNM